MTLSVTEPIGRALTRTRAILFEPFDLSKWLTLGFCAFLARLGDSARGGASGNIGSWREPGGSRQVERVLGWIREHWELIVTFGALALLVVAAIWVAVLWLQARGRFLFLDGVVRNRGAVGEPWRAYRAEAGSAFRFKLAMALIGLAAVAIVVGIGIGMAWTDIDAERFGPAAWLGVLVGGGLLLLLAVTLSLIDLFLNDFVVPAMYARRIGVLEAWGVVRREVLAAHPAQVVLYVLVRILIAVVAGILVMGLVCGTLCVAACFLVIPYVGTVLLLPLLVFVRCYSLHFLEQLGGEWELFPRLPEQGGAAEQP